MKSTRSMLGNPSFSANQRYELVEASLPPGSKSPRPVPPIGAVVEPADGAKALAALEAASCAALAQLAPAARGGSFLLQERVGKRTRISIDLVTVLS